MARGTGRDCSWWEQADSRVSNREREGEMERGGPASRRGGKNVCVKENKREIKRGGWHRQKEGWGGEEGRRGRGGGCLIKYVPMFV